MPKKQRKINPASIQTNTDKTQTNTEKIPHKFVSSPYKSVIMWQAPEYESAPKDVGWYWLSLIAAITLLALALWQKNFLFAVFIIIAELAVIAFAKQAPMVWQFQIDEKGIKIGQNKFYPYAEIEGFDIHPAGEKYKELVVKTKSKFSPYIKINITAEDEGKINQFLQRFIAREEYPPSLVDSLFKLTRF